ncbi:tail fiber domain-containing protein [Flavobacterium sp.]|uniref:tail fiber domain-containing protein n=1 Tax=Flavobacterium sp. TaxID=239 RepID=UPI001B73AF49|nr:tail fiber domain-containing protein [Flavobacterium sp.]MBP6128035.1 tail fiber domain-containing protein [Flavobacterium sp.]
MKKIFFLLLLSSLFGFAQTGIGTTTPATKLHVKSNGATFRLEGTDHTYMEFFPQGASTRFGWIGFPSANVNDLTISSQNASGSLIFNTNNSERFRINSLGLVGIGNTAPISTLTIGNATGTIPGEITLYPTTGSFEGGQINIKKSLVGSTADWIIDQYGTSAAEARLRIFNTTEANGIIIKENGFIGMGTSNPTVRLQVAGDIIANSIAGSSDSRFKTNILPIENPLQKVLKLQGVTFDWKTKEFPSRMFSENRALGFIAQEVEQVIPEVVQTENSTEGFKSVQYDKVVALLVEAIKEQQKQIEQLQQKVKELTEKK